MDAPILVAVIGGAATVTAATIAAVASLRKRKADAESARDPKPQLIETERLPLEQGLGQKQIAIAAQTVTAGRDIHVQQIIGAPYKVNDRPSALVLDTVRVEIGHSGTCASKVGSPFEEGAIWAPTLSVALSNTGSTESLLISRIQIEKQGKYPSTRCSFPNDEITGAMIRYYDLQVDLEDDGALMDVLHEPIQLQPSETSCLRIAFAGSAGYCYALRLRIFWKCLGHPSGETILSDRYLVQFSSSRTRWEDEIARSAGDVITLRLARGLRKVDEYLTDIPGVRVSKKEIPRNSTLDEFIILGDRAVIVPVLPPKDQYIESSSPAREGLLLTSNVLVAKYKEAFRADSTVSDWS